MSGSRSPEKVPGRRVEFLAGLCAPKTHAVHAVHCYDSEIGTSRGYFPGACLARSGGTDVG
eukprot:46907-Prymnesium_polylepis.1